MESAHPLVLNRKTKIVCTLGPATESREMVRKLLKAGMDIARINCSHGTPETRREMFHNVRSSAEELGYFIPVMFDLQGPKIRIGRLQKPVELKQGDLVTLRVDDAVGSGLTLTTTFPTFATDVQVGHPILIDDGRVSLVAEQILPNAVVARVETGGVVTDRKGINLPKSSVSVHAMSEKDHADLREAVSLGVDFVAISFVRNASDITHVREQAVAAGAENLQLIAKIERPEAVRHIRDIIEVADGLMVARGDLGVEVGSHRVPMIQKEIIMRANMANRFVITATQMLDSMMHRPVPTRAEASDVANAILDGTDACMLSGETASGDYPIESIETMVRIARETEAHQLYRYQTPPMAKGSIHKIPDGIGMATYQLASLMNARLLVAFSNSGSSALQLSKKHPDCMVVGATIHAHIARRMRAYWGVFPVLLNRPDTLEDMFGEVKAKIVELELAGDGDLVIITAGYPMWTSGSTNLIKAMTIEIDTPPDHD